MDFIIDQPSGQDLPSTLQAVRSLVSAQLVTLYQRRPEPPHDLVCVPSQKNHRERLLHFCQALMAGEEPALMLEAGHNFELAFHDRHNEAVKVKSYLSLLLEHRPEEQAPSCLLCLFYSEPGGFSNLDGETLSNIRDWVYREIGSTAPKSQTQS